MQTPRLRYGVIGIGAGVFGMHRRALQLPEVELVGGADLDEVRGRTRADEMRCPFYSDYRQLLAEARPEVVVVMVPHTVHAKIAIECLRQGAHVLVEKPIALQVKEADEMIAAARAAERQLGVVFQHRFRPEIRAASALLREGKLGELQAVSLRAVWPRTAGYFALAPWRGTWAGEGGGVLMNQAAHNLDLLCHLVGLPQQVHAWTRRLVHTIQAEDTVQASLEWPGGALGSVHISTAETGVAERIELVGMRGHLTITPGKLALQLLDVDFKEHAFTNPEPFAVPGLREVPVELDHEGGDHTAVYRSFHQAIVQHLEHFNTDGEQGRMSLELANVMIYASHTQSTVTLPLDRQKYAELLQKLQEG